MKGEFCIFENLFHEHFVFLCVRDVIEHWTYVGRIKCWT
jgi:hypothetical protein